MSEIRHSGQINPCREIVVQEESVMPVIWHPAEYLQTSWRVQFDIQWKLSILRHRLEGQSAGIMLKTPPEVNFILCLRFEARLSQVCFSLIKQQQPWILFKGCSSESDFVSGVWVAFVSFSLCLFFLTQDQTGCRVKMLLWQNKCWYCRCERSAVWRSRRGSLGGLQSRLPVKVISFDMGSYSLGRPTQGLGQNCMRAAQQTQCKTSRKTQRQRDRMTEKQANEK